MKAKGFLISGMIAVAAIVAVSLYLAPSVAAQGSTSTVPVFVTQQTQFGMISVNESTGAISFCANNTVVPGGGGQAPIGTCSASSIGSVTPTVGSNNSLSIQGSETISSGGGGSGALVYNNQTGQAVLCAGSGVVSGGVANVVASCKSVANLH
jgi:hypothetical protein